MSHLLKFEEDSPFYHTAKIVHQLKPELFKKLCECRAVVKKYVSHEVYYNHNIMKSAEKRKCQYTQTIESRSNGEQVYTMEYINSKQQKRIEINLYAFGKEQKEAEISSQRVLKVQDKEYTVIGEFAFDDLQDGSERFQQLAIDKNSNMKTAILFDANNQTILRKNLLAKNFEVMPQLELSKQK